MGVSETILFSFSLGPQEAAAPKLCTENASWGATSLALRHPSHFTPWTRLTSRLVLLDTPSPPASARRDLSRPSSSASPRRLTGLVATGPWLCLPEGHVSLNLLSVQLTNHRSPHQAKWAKPCHHPRYQPRFTALGAPSTEPTSRLLHVG